MTSNFDEPIEDLVRRLGPVAAVKIWVEDERITADRIVEIKDTTILPWGFQLTDAHADLDAEDMLELGFLPVTYQKVMTLFYEKDY